MDVTLTIMLQILNLESNGHEEMPRRLDYEAEFQEVRDKWKW